MYLSTYSFTLIKFKIRYVLTLRHVDLIIIIVFQGRYGENGGRIQAKPFSW